MGTLDNITARLEAARAQYQEAKRDGGGARIDQARAEIRKWADAEREAEREAEQQAELEAAREAVAQDAARKKAQLEKEKAALAKFGVRKAQERYWILEPYLLDGGITQITARADELPAATDFLVDLAVKVSRGSEQAAGGDVVLVTKHPDTFAAKFAAAGGDPDALKIFTACDFSDLNFRDDFGAALDSIGGDYRLFMFPDLAEFVSKANSQPYSAKVLEFIRPVHDNSAAVFLWPSSQRRQAAGCALWTNAGDVNLSIADIRPEAPKATLTPRERALWFLGGALASGPKPLKEILAAAADFGIKPTTFYAAARDIVNSTRANDKFGEAVWELRRDRINTMFFADSSQLGADAGVK